MDVTAGHLVEKIGTEFSLQTAHSSVIFRQPSGLPAMREGDTLLVVMSDYGQILAISDVSIGVEMQYRPFPPFKDETLSARWLLLVNMFVLALPLIGYSAAQAGLPLGSMYLLSGIAFLYAGLYISHWHRVKNHNAHTSNEVQACLRHALMDETLWEVPESHDSETWKD